MAIIKVHQGLDKIARDQAYHLGHYDVDFQDGCLRFQLHVRICSKKDCICDDLQINWLTGDHTISTWYTSDHEWRGLDHKPLNAELVQTLQSVEKTELFHQRVQHLLYLRRRQILGELEISGVNGPIAVPKDLLLSGHDGRQGILGEFRIRIKGKDIAFPYGIEFCANQDCFCDSLLILLHREDETFVYDIDAEDGWSVADKKPATSRLLPKFKRRMMGAKKFKQQLAFFRIERRLNNYGRFTAAYPQSIAN